MIELTNHRGEAVFLAPGAIASVEPAGAASAWHGVRAFLRTFDGRTIELQDTPDAVARKVAKVEAPPPSL